MKYEIPHTSDTWKLIHETPRLHGEIGLWLLVMIDAYETILRNDGHSHEAINFLLEGNIVFDAIALALEYDDPETLRKRIRDSLSRE